MKEEEEEEENGELEEKLERSYRRNQINTALESK